MDINTAEAMAAAVPQAAGAGALAPASPSFDNSSVWNNLTAWTAMAMHLNMSKLLAAPSLEDLVWAGPRMVSRLGRLGAMFISFDTIDQFGQRIIPKSAGPADAFDHATTTATATASRLADAFMQITSPSAASAAAASAGTSGGVATGANATTAVAPALDAAGTDLTLSTLAARISLEGAQAFASVFSYATSKWALCCVIMAVIFNRTHIFAATRRRLRLPWLLRLLVRILPIILLAAQARRLLQSIQCQTSPEFAELRWGNVTPAASQMAAFQDVSANASAVLDTIFAHADNPLLRWVSSTLLLGASDAESCRAVQMVPSAAHWDTLNGEEGQGLEHLKRPEKEDLRGSLSRLWPLFGTFCLSHFVETLSCTVQGRPVATETGMTLFEHSLAFAEADAAIRNHLGWGLFSGNKTSNPALEAAAVDAASSRQAAASKDAAIAVTRSMIMRRVNTPPGVLLVALISTMSHITSHILAVFNLQAKVRLLSTGFWGLCFMGSVLPFVLDDSVLGTMHFPTVSFVAFIPHVLVLIGILGCFSIYLLALLLSASAAAGQFPSTNDQLRQPQAGFLGRLAQAHANMQANISLADVRIRMDMDFYTALLRAGFSAITMASEAVYLNEDRKLSLKPHTWLEEERFREIESFRMQWLGDADSVVPGSRHDAIGLVPIQDDLRVLAALAEKKREFRDTLDTRSYYGLGSASRPRGAGGDDGRIFIKNGYAREKAAQTLSSKNGSRSRRNIRDGVGAAERSGRWVMALEYTTHVNRLVTTTWALVTIRMLSVLGVRNPPWWLHQLAQRPGKTAGAARSGAKTPKARHSRQRLRVSPTEGVFSGDEWTDEAESSSSRDKRPGVISVTAGDGSRKTILVPRSDAVDVEAEVRKAMQTGSESEASALRQNEAEMDTSLYSWWARGGWWGNVDSSGDFVPDEDDDGFDVTSVVSETEMSDPGDGWESDRPYADGQRTPTQKSPWEYPTFPDSSAFATRPPSRQSDDTTFDMPLTPAELARLLNPANSKARDEARALAAHLAHDGGGGGVMTRSRYRRFQQRQRVEVLLSSGGDNGGNSSSSSVGRFDADGTRMTPDEEAVRLEEMLLARRRAAAGGSRSPATASAFASGARAWGGGGTAQDPRRTAPASVSNDGQTWATGAAGLGPDAPQCVVCQSAGRTVITWPCRCLSMCDDCRVSLAMNNFDKCVCCRREVVSFSRIYVP